MSGAGADWPSPPPLRWWGWGDRDVQLHPAFLALLEGEVGVPATPQPPVALEQVRMPAARLAPAARRRLEAVVGPGHLVDERESRVRHATGRSYLDLVALRRGELAAAPDLVAFPDGADDVVALLEVCSEADLAVVPFGGGTSVVGGVAPLAGDHAGVVSLDLGRLDGFEDLDLCALTARLGAGLRGPDVERRLAGHGLCLDHLPQSFEYASIGGYAATRSAGQMSAGAGRFDQLVLGVHCVTPTGLIAVAPQPASAAGPSLLQLILGSEGTLGVITDVVVQLRRLPAERRYAGFALPSFAAGLEALREMAQVGANPDLARLSDEAETRFSLALGDRGRWRDRLARGYLHARHRQDGCLLICGWEGEDDQVGARARRAESALAHHGGVSLGQAPGRAWRRSRFLGPYLRDALLDRGLLVETVETATSWPRLGSLREAIGAAIGESLADRGTPAMVGCHVSHAYRSGASLYVTVIARQDVADPVGQWQAAKAAATRAILAGGATITHHHGVGVDHAPSMRAEVGDTGLELLVATKCHLDPRGILNPGKLLSANPSRPSEVH